MFLGVPLVVWATALIAFAVMWVVANDDEGRWL